MFKKVIPEKAESIKYLVIDSRLRGNDKRIIYFVLLVSFPSTSDLYF